MMNEVVGSFDSSGKLVAYGRCKTCHGVGLYGYACYSSMCEEKRRRQREEMADMPEGEGQWDMFDVIESTKFVGKPLDEDGNILQGYVMEEVLDKYGCELGFKLKKELTDHVGKEEGRSSEKQDEVMGSLDSSGELVAYGRCKTCHGIGS